MVPGLSYGDIQVSELRRLEDLQRAARRRRVGGVAGGGRWLPTRRHALGSRVVHLGAARRAEPVTPAAALRDAPSPALGSAR